MTKLPEQLRKTLTWDRGKELSGHAQFAFETGTKVFFADPHSPWQRPTNENTNGLLRQYFPKGTDLSRWSAEDLEAVALALNNRPPARASLIDQGVDPSVGSVGDAPDNGLFVIQSALTSWWSAPLCSSERQR
jgi:hypothetical protein